MGIKDVFGEKAGDNMKRFDNCYVCKKECKKPPSIHFGYSFCPGYVPKQNLIGHNAKAYTVFHDIVRCHNCNCTT